MRIRGKIRFSTYKIWDVSKNLHLPTHIALRNPSPRKTFTKYIKAKSFLVFQYPKKEFLKDQLSTFYNIFPLQCNDYLQCLLSLVSFRKV